MQTNKLAFRCTDDVLATIKAELDRMQQDRPGETVSISDCLRSLILRAAGKPPRRRRDRAA